MLYEPKEDLLNPKVILQLIPQTYHWDPHTNVYKRQEHDLRGDIKKQVPKKFIVSCTILSCTTDPLMFASAL